MKEFGRIFFVGVVILIGAILINFLGYMFGLSNWYVFIELISNEGFLGALRAIGLISFIYLVTIYPFLLGLLAYLVSKIRIHS